MSSRESRKGFELQGNGHCLSQGHGDQLRDLLSTVDKRQLSAGAPEVRRPAAEAALQAALPGVPPSARKALSGPPSLALPNAHCPAKLTVLGAWLSQRSSSRQFFDSADWELAQLERMEEGLPQQQQRLAEALPIERGPSARKAHSASRLGRS